MSITRVQWMGFRVPFRRPFVTARATTTHRYGLLLLVHADTGSTGVGEASPVEATDVAAISKLAAGLRAAAPGLLGAPLKEALDRLGHLPRLARSGALRFGLETALYDALGKAASRPVAALLGGSPRPVAVNATLAADVPSEAARQAAEAAAQGFPCVKVKIGGAGTVEDQALVSAVREAVGSSVRIRADANGAWSAQEAIARIARLERSDLEYVEQPVAAGDTAGMARVRRSVRVPVAADESVATVADARRLLAAGAADVLVVKAARTGGLQASLEIMRLAHAHGCATVVTSSLESGVGVAASLHLAATLPAGSPACGLATAKLLEHDLLAQLLAPADGTLAAPSAPGLGVELDLEAVRRYSIGVEGAVGE